MDLFAYIFLSLIRIFMRWLGYLLFQLLYLPRISQFSLTPLRVNVFLNYTPPLKSVIIHQNLKLRI
jgi:hypothetical protein